MERMRSRHFRAVPIFFGGFHTNSDIGLSLDTMLSGEFAKVLGRGREAKVEVKRD